MMSLMSVLPVASISLLVTTWIGLALAAFGEAMRDPVMTTSSTSGGAVALGGGGVCALAAPARHTAAADVGSSQRVARPARAGRAFPLRQRLAPLTPRGPAVRARAVAARACGYLRSLAHGPGEVCVLRLLDHIAQCTQPFMVHEDGGALWRLTGAGDFALPLARCPLRYVLTEDLVRTCTALAYSDGDELSGCLDLLHIPAEQLWIEWDDAARRDELLRVLPPCAPVAPTDVLRAGTLISSEPRGRSGRLRTFWLTRAQPHEPLLASVETLIDLDGGLSTAPTAALLDGQTVAVRDSGNRQLNDLLHCAGFRLEPSWQ